jgi:parallel beta-helix repeat protein
MRQKTFVAVAGFLALLIFSPLAANGAVGPTPDTWTQVNTDGFGDADNYSAYRMITYNNRIYVGIFGNNGPVWEYDGTNWTQVNTTGFGDVNNAGINSMAVFNSKLYVGTYNNNGTEVWEYNGSSWTQVNADGFGDSGNYAADSMAVYNSYLYVAVANTAGVGIWRTAGAGGPPFSDWTQVNSDGFGNSYNARAYNMVEHSGKLFVGTYNTSTGTEVWSTAAFEGPPFTDWNQVNTDGFGNSNNSLTRSMAVYGTKLYVGTDNGTTGAEVWRTAGTGTPPFSDWTQVNSDGFGNSSNTAAKSMAEHNGNLFVGTDNSSTGGEVWEYNGSSWAQANNDGFGDPNNFYANSMAVLNNGLYVGTYNTSTGAEVRVKGVPPGTHYVDRDQSSEGDGSSGNPWKTLHYAIQQINDSPSGTFVLNVAAGTYSLESNEENSQLTLSHDDVTIQGAGPGSTILDGLNAESWSPGIKTNNASNVIIKDMEIRNFNSYGIEISAGSGNVIQGCAIHDNDSMGIYVVSSSPEIKQNEIYDNLYGIYVTDSGGTASPDIQNNLIYDTNELMNYGIYLYSTSGTTVNPKIYHNTIDGNNASSKGIYLWKDPGASLNPEIKYNIITNFSQYGLYSDSGYGGSPTIDYNNVWHNGSGTKNENYNGYSPGAHDLYENTPGDGLGKDPLYGSYNLLEGSPCIDAIPTGAEDPVTVDLEGTSRPKGSGYDMGAYEYVPQYDLTVTTVGQGTVDPTGGTYDEDTVVTLTATADSGWVFSGWSGDLTGSTNPETITMDSAKSVTATFSTQLTPGDYYVDASQTSEGDGSESSPFKTLHNAVEQINNGSSGTYVLSLSAGTYSVGGGENDQSLTITQDNVTIIGESGSSPVLDGTNASSWGYGIGIDQDADSVRIYNLEIANFSTAGLIIEGTGASVTNCDVHDNATGLWLESTASDATIEDNQIHENDTGHHSIGVWIKGASGVTVARNQIYTHEDYGIGVEDCNPTIQRNEIYDNESGIDIWAYTQEASPQITNNLIYTGASGITMSAMDESASPGIYHNTIDSGTEDGIYCHGAGATPDIKYNIITSFGAYGINNTGGSPTIAYNNVYGNATAQYGGDTTSQTGTNGNISQDPLYGSYELQSSSPCIDKIPTDSGDPVTVDYAGYARPKDAGYDMGAYEFIADIAHGFTLPGGTGDATDYRMFTVPVTLASGSSLKQSMEDALGTYNKFIWRVFAWDPGTSEYIEMDDSAFAELEVYPGRGFWVISTSTDTITFSGQPAPDGDYTEVPISPGWNMVALPWPSQSVELDEIAVSDGLNNYWITSTSNTLTQQYVWDYTGTGTNNGYEQRASGATLEPGTAYWIKVLGTAELTMLVPKDNEGGYFTASSVRTASEASTTPEDTEQPPPPPGLSVSFDSTSSDGGTKVSGSGGCFIGTVAPME